MASLTEFDIVGVPPHVDLVLFDNVISCYQSSQDITANYTLGEAVRSSNWDWVGIFPYEWQYLGQFVTYCWAPINPNDCTAPRRRAISFRHSINPDRQKMYQFLYIADGNHVAGVSIPFRVTDEPECPDMYLSALFREPCINHSRTAKRKAARRRHLEAKKHRPDETSFQLVDETRCSPVPKRRVAGKQKLTNVYRDLTTLNDLVTTDWTKNLQIVQVDVDHQVVQEFSTALLPYHGSDQLKVYDVRRNNQTSTSHHPLLALETVDRPRIEYPTMLSLPTGPLAFAQSVLNSTDTCPSCLVGRTLVQDLTGREEVLQEKVASLEKQLKNLRNVRTREKTVYRLQGSGPRDTRTLLDWCLRQVQKDNLTLKARNVELESLLASARQDQRLAGRPLDDYDEWIVMEPKRIARFKKVIGKQSRNIHLLKEALQNKQTEAVRLREDNSSLRIFLQNTRDNSENFRRLAEQLETQIKSVLAGRSVDGVNEWHHSKTVKQETSTTQTSASPEPETSSTTKQTKSRDHIKNKQISKLLKSEQNRKSKLHKERSQAEKCPTCGLKFSVKTDRHVIEEHMTFHKRFQS